ncbi:MAG: endonuclease [Candidatus Schekmanbacteria bacterium]|nr:endonuclease [Candidatus Schekmanbacteria bacterium]
MGGGAPALERTLSDLIAGARREILLTAYSVTPGSERIWEEIERALATGIRATIVVNRIAEQCDEARHLLDRLSRSSPETLALHDFRGEDDASGLHAKVLVVDRRSALVGSANLSHRGMVTAHEMAMVVSGPAADGIADRIDALVRSPLVSRVC